MDKLEKLIYSQKYLPPFLYFGSAGLIGFDIYSDIFKEVEFLNQYVETPLFILFFNWSKSLIFRVDSENFAFAKSISLTKSS